MAYDGRAPKQHDDCAPINCVDSVFNYYPEQTTIHKTVISH
jgi:hypothetical protein